MKVYKPIGSKERLVEIFQKVNNVKLNESLYEMEGQGLNQQNVLNMSFDALKNNRLKIKHSSTQTNDNESFIELVCSDNEGNNITFTFKAVVNEGDQEGVFDINEVGIDSFSFDSVKTEESVEISGDALKQFNAQHSDELLNIVQRYIDVESPELEPSAELQEAIKLIDAIKKDSYPFGGGDDRMQTGVNYADKKPTNPAVRVKAPELEKTVQENIEEYDKPEQKLIMQPMASTSNIQKESIDDIDDVPRQEFMGFDPNTAEEPIEEPEDELDDEKPVVQPEPIEEPEEELTPGKREIILQAYQNLISQKGSNYAPKMEEIEAEVEKLSGKPVVKKEKIRTFPKDVEPFLESLGAGLDIDIPAIIQKYRDTLNPETKEKFINSVKEMVDYVIGPEKYRLSNEEYVKLIKDAANQAYAMTLTAFNETEMLAEDKEKSDYPDPIGKEFSPKKKYPKEKKKHSNKVKLSEEEEITPEENPEETPMNGGEENIEQIAKEKEEAGEEIPGGKGEGKSPLEFDPEQIKKGMQVEMEHTDDPMVSLEIALDHLSEDPEYYTEKETPKASAQFGAAKDAGEEKSRVEIDNPDLYPDGWKEMDGMFMNPENPMYKKMHGTDDKETADMLLGFKPHNVGDYEGDGEEVPHTPETPEMPQEVGNKLGENLSGKKTLDLVPITTQRDSKGFRQYHAKDNPNELFAEKDGVLYNTDEMGNPTTSLRMNMMTINGLVDDNNLPNDKLGFEKQGIKDVEKSFGVGESKESDLKQRDPASWHQIQIAKKTIKMPGAMAGVMGGMSKEEAQRILKQRGIKTEEVQINGSASTGVSASNTGSQDSTSGDNDDLKKYEEYKQKPFDSMNDNEKQQYFQLFNKFQGK